MTVSCYIEFSSVLYDSVNLILFFFVITRIHISVKRTTFILQQHVSHFLSNWRKMTFTTPRVHISFKLSWNKVESSSLEVSILTFLLFCNSHPRPLPPPSILPYLYTSPTSSSTLRRMPLLFGNLGHWFSGRVAASLGTTWGNSSLNVK
jgi:hypothetical protein